RTSSSKGPDNGAIAAGQLTSDRRSRLLVRNSDQGREKPGPVPGGSPKAGGTVRVHHWSNESFTVTPCRVTTAPLVGGGRPRKGVWKSRLLVRQWSGGGAGTSFQSAWLAGRSPAR